jgi:hypothetical protein
MRLHKLLLTFLLMFVSGPLTAQTGKVKSESVYKLRPSDPEAGYFALENFNIKADGKMDIFEALRGNKC